jgi:Ni/Fe-hydrogenase subunit HybB-like protein
MALLASRRVRHSPRGLSAACACIMGGVALNRANVYWLGYHPASVAEIYRPSAVEWIFTVGVLAALALAWKALAIQLPILERESSP